MNRFLTWFYCTTVGGLYFDFLLWVDRVKFRRENKKKYLNPATKNIVMQMQKIKIAQGVGNIKRKVGELTASSTKEEYEKVLDELKELMPLAEDNRPELKKMKKALYEVWVFKGGKDIRSTTDRAKMVDRRIQHYKELHEHKIKREEIRKQRKKCK